MNRRQFGAMVATATLSLGGIAGAASGASAQETDPLQIEDVSVSLGGVTTNVGSAMFSFDDGTMQFEAQDWTMEGEERSVSIATASVTADDVSAETYATLRSAMVEGYEGRSLSPVLSAVAEADINPDSQVELVAESVEMDGELVADQITATGTAGSVVAEGTRDLLQDGASLEEVAALGPSEWSSVTVQRGEAELTANDVVMQLDGATVAISSPGGEASVSGRSFEFSEMEMNVLPPETIPEEHVAFASQLRQAAEEGDLSLSAIDSAAEESGVTAENTADAVRSAQFDLSFAEVTEGGEVVVQNFETSGTIGELVAALRQQA